MFRLREEASAPSLEQVRQHLASVGLAKQKWPESLYRVDEFPRTLPARSRSSLRQQLREVRLAAYA